MNKAIYILSLAIFFCGCKKTEQDENIVIYKNIGLTIPLNSAYIYKYEPKDQYTSDITFSYKIKDSLHVAEFVEYYGIFKCNGINNYTDKVGLNESITAKTSYTEAYKFLEAKVSTTGIIYNNTNNIKFDEEFYVPFYTFITSDQTLPYVGWIRIKCTKTEMIVYDMALKRKGSINAGEK